MNFILDPNSGLCNPLTGLDFNYFCRMTGKKAPKSNGRLKSAFADNVKLLMDTRYPLSPNKPRSLAKDAGISLSSVQRAISGETAPTLDTVEAIADALRVDATYLITNHNQKRRTGTND